MAKVSFILPSRNEQFTARTVEDILAKARGEIEVIVVCDGWWPVPRVPDDVRVRLLHFGTAGGMRPGINAAARIATGEYLLKLDAHCMVGEGIDEILKADMQPDWVVVPRRYSLDAERWRNMNDENKKAPVDYHFLSYPYEKARPGHGLHGQVWIERAKARAEILVDDEMSSQGSCWFMAREYFLNHIGQLDVEGYGNFVQEFQEIGNKVWLGGGRVVINKKTWYSHLHKGKEYGRGYYISRTEMSDGSRFCVVYWMNNRWAQRVHDMRWLIEKFWPVPSWPKDASGALDWDEVERGTSEFTQMCEQGADMKTLGV